jgi:hypothetical protein
MLEFAVLLLVVLRPMNRSQPPALRLFDFPFRGSLDEIADLEWSLFRPGVSFMDMCTRGSWDCAL